MDSATGPPKTIKQKIWHFIEHPLALTGAAVVLALIGTKGSFAFAWILLTIAAIRTKFFETSPPRRRVLGNFLLSVGIAVGLSTVWAIWFREPDKPAISTYAQSIVNPVGVYVAGLPWPWILLGGAIGAAIGEVFTKRWVRKYPERLGIVIEEICPHRRLHAVAKTDKESIDTKVRIPWIIYQPHFDGAEPYIDFVFSIFNNSLFDLIVDHSIKGDIWSENFEKPLHYEPKFIPARPIRCGSRSGTNFVIRHELRVEEVSRFEGKEILIWFEGLEITFSGTAQFPEIVQTKLNTKGFCLEIKKGAYRNPNDKDEFAFLYTDEQWALLAGKPEMIALPTGQSETEKALIESRNEVTTLQRALTRATEANEEKDRQLDSLNTKMSATVAQVAPKSDVRIGKIHCSIMNSETGERLRASVVAENDLTRKTYKDVADRTGGLELPVPFGSYSVEISADGYHTRVCAANVDNEFGATLHVRLEMLEEKRREVFKGQRERTIAQIESCIRGGTDLLNAIMKAQDSMDAEVQLWETTTATCLTTRVGKYHADIFLSDKNMPEFQPHQGKPYHANLTRVNARVHKLAELMANLQQQLEHDMY